MDARRRKPTLEELRGEEAVWKSVFGKLLHSNAGLCAAVEDSLLDTLPYAEAAKRMAHKRVERLPGYQAGSYLKPRNTTRAGNEMRIRLVVEFLLKARRRRRAEEERLGEHDER